MVFKKKGAYCKHSVGYWEDSGTEKYSTKTVGIQIRSEFQLTVLYQCWFPGFDNFTMATKYGYIVILT